MDRDRLGQSRPGEGQYRFFVLCCKSFFSFGQDAMNPRQNERLRRKSFGCNGLEIPSKFSKKTPVDV
jgi:hypothetical protein